MLLMLAAAFPALFWDQPADTAQALRDAGIQQIVVPQARLAAWKAVNGISAEAGNPAAAVKVPAPTVNYRMNEATATSAPWLVANGWRFIRRPGARFYYDAPGKQAALAAAEAFCYGANAIIQTDSDGLHPLAEMLAFLHSLPDRDLPPVADIGYIDDGSAASGEVINLLVRNNLLFELVPAPDRRFRVNVKLGTKEYPVEDAKNPGTIAHLVRANLSDDRRSLRVYGSQVVVARLNASGARARIQLLNYAGANRKVEGIRLRVLGRYPDHQLAIAGSPGAKLLDYSVQSDATEFTLPELSTYAVVDLSR